MGKAAKLNVTAAVKMARMKAAAKENGGESILASFLKKAARIYGGMAMVIEEALNNAADAELKTRYQLSHRKHLAD